MVIKLLTTITTDPAIVGTIESVRQGQKERNMPRDKVEPEPVEY